MILSFLSFLFPSWKLFDETFEIPTLFYQVDESEWLQFLENRAPRSYELFFNPTGILYLLIQSRIHRLLNDLTRDLNESELIANSNYQFLNKIVNDRLIDYKYKSYRFKLMYISTQESILISKEYYV